MSDAKPISEMCTRFNDVIISLKALSKDIPKVQLVNKILRSLPKSWEPKVTVILEAKDLTMLTLEQLVESLITHEMLTSTNDRKKKKYLALKVFTVNDDCDDDEEEETAFLSRKFKQFLTREM